MIKKRSKYKWADWNRKRPADVCVGKAIVLSKLHVNSHIGDDYISGDTVDIALGIMTNDGPRYRVMGSNTWVDGYQVIADSSVRTAVGNNPDNVMKRKDRNEFITPAESVKIKTIENSTARVASLKNVRVNNNNNVSSKEKNKHMDKSVLKSAIAGLTAGQNINLTFVGAKSHFTGDWSVVKIKTGKGKGGSKLMELVNDTQETITTGTPESQYILNMTVDGNMIGYASEADVPAVFEKNTEKATELKSVFAALKGAEGNKRVTITATVPELTGTFIVNKQSQLRGRGGQIRLDLARVDSDETVEAWSLRHSGIIQTFVIDEDEAD